MLQTKAQFTNVNYDREKFIVQATGGSMFYNFYFVINHKIAYNSTTTEARVKIWTYLESLEFFKCMFDYMYRHSNFI